MINISAKMEIKVYPEEKLDIDYNEVKLLECIDHYNVPGKYYKLKATDSSSHSKTMLIMNNFLPTIAFNPFHEYF